MLLEKKTIQDLNSQFDTVLDAGPGMILVYVKDGGYFKCLFARGSFAAKLGFKSQELQGKLLHEIFSSDAMDYMTTYFQTAWEGLPLYFKHHTPDNASHYIVHLTPILEGNKVEQVVAQFSDMTQFVGHMQQAQEFDNTKLSFWKNINSEIRTPLNSVSGILSLLLDTSLDESQRSYVTIIQDSFNHLTKVLDDLLEFSKLEMGAVQLETGPFNAKDVIENTLDSLRLKADQKNIDLNLKYHEGVSEVMEGDQERMRLITQNVAESILQTLPENGQLDFEVMSNAKNDGRALKCSISYLETLQNKKVRKDINLRDLSSINFAVANRLVQMMQGEIREQNTDGHKSLEFSLETVKPKTGSDKNALKLHGKLADLNILCVVPQDHQKDEAITLLQREGAHMLFLHNEIKIIENLMQNAGSKQGYHILILDDDAVEMSTLEMVQTVRSKPAFKNLLIIVLLPKIKQKQERTFLKFGATAVVTTPLEKEALLREILSQSPQKQLQAAIKETQEAASAPKKERLQIWANILIAEDNPVNRMMAEKVLEKMGCQTTGVENGKKAVEAVKAQNFDLILMDCQMPEMDGYQASKEIKDMVHEGLTPNVPIIALTAQTGKDDRERCIQAGMDNYLKKPVSIDRLREVLQMYLRHRILRR